MTARAHTIHTIDCDAEVAGFAAAFLRVAGDECAFVESYTAHALPRLLAALAAAGRRPEEVRWIAVTHAHLDHAAGAGALMQACPRATLLAHPRAARHLIQPDKLIAGATLVYGAERFARLYGRIDPIPAERVRALDDGASFELGGARFSVHHTAGHANHHLVVHDHALAAVFTGDAFGLVYPALQRHGRFALASTSPVGFDAPEARASLERILALGCERAYLTHFGAVADLAEVAAQVRAWVDRAEGWVEAEARSGDGAGRQARLAAAWREAIAADPRGRHFSAQEWQLLALDVELNAQGLAVVAERLASAARGP